VLAVKFVVDVVGVWVAQQGLGLLMICLVLTHWLSCEVDCAGNAIESQVQLVQFFIRVLKAELDSSVLSLVVRGDLIQGLVQVDYMRCYFEGKPFHAKKTHDNQDYCGSNDANRDLDKNVLHKFGFQLSDRAI